MSQGLLRRKDKVMSEAEIEAFLAQATIGHFGTVSPDGFPYVVPNLFVYADGKVYTHNTHAHGHFRQNIENNNRICFEVSQIGQVWAYGEFECDTTASYQSIVAFGKISVEADPERKAAIFDKFMAKYSNPNWQRPQGFYPRLEQVTVYTLEFDQLTGKKGEMPPQSEQWPAKNNTRSPNARPS